MASWCRRVFPVSSLAAAALLCVTAADAAAEYVPLKALLNKDHYLRTNLHVAPRNRYLSSVNYQVVGILVPWGTPVRVELKPGAVAGDEESIFLRNVKDNTLYPFFFHHRTAKYSSKHDYFTRIFADDPTVVQREVEQLSEVDREGIAKGIVLKGMSRKGVGIALGFPPEFVNPDPDNAAAWHYWYDKDEKFSVLFGKDGLVEQVKGRYPPARK
jgi:hypothetical protein